MQYIPRFQSIFAKNKRDYNTNCSATSFMEEAFVNFATLNKYRSQSNKMPYSHKSPKMQACWWLVGIKIIWAKAQGAQIGHQSNDRIARFWCSRTEIKSPLFKNKSKI